MSDGCETVGFLNYGEDRLAQNYINAFPTERKDTPGAGCDLFAFQKRLLTILLITVPVVCLASNNEAAAHGPGQRPLWVVPGTSDCIDEDTGADTCCINEVWVHPNKFDPQQQKFVRDGVRDEAGRRMRIVTILRPLDLQSVPQGRFMDELEIRDTPRRSPVIDQPRVEDNFRNLRNPETPVNR